MSTEISAAPVPRDGLNLVVRTSSPGNKADRGSSSGNSQGSSSPPTSGRDDPEASKTAHKKEKAPAEEHENQWKDTASEETGPYKTLVFIS